MSTHHGHSTDLDLLIAAQDASAQRIAQNGIDLVRRCDGSIARFRIRNGATLNNAMPEDAQGAGLSYVVDGEPADAMSYATRRYCDRFGYHVAHAQYDNGTLSYVSLRKSL